MYYSIFADCKTKHKSIESCLKELINIGCETEIMFLVDICSVYSNTVEHIQNLLRLILSFRLKCNIKMVIAMTSGLGIHLPPAYGHLHVYFSLIYTMPKCRFTLFSISEAKLYIEHQKQNCIMDMKVIKELTNLNPYYLSRINPKENQYKNQGRIKAEVAAYFSSLVKSFSLDDLCSLMLPELEESQRWFYKASNGIFLDTCEFNEFVQSWVYSQHICEYKKSHGKHKLVYALPFSENLLVTELSKLQPTLPLPKNPVIDGYVYEEKVFHFMNNAKKLDVLTNKESLCLSLSYVCKKSDTLIKLDKSIMYQLRYKHPIIDGIGILQDERNVWWLAFIQISLSPYLSHHTKVTDLFKHHACHETRSASDEICTLFSYYMDMCDIPVAPIYINISPEEVRSSGKLWWETGGQNILIGVIQYSKGIEKICLGYVSIRIFRNVSV